MINVFPLFQLDSLTIDLGYVTNAGYSVVTGLYQPHDATFEIGVEVELSDHVDTTHATTYDIYFAVKFNDVIVVSK